MSVTALRCFAYRHGLNLEKGHSRAELVAQVKELFAHKQSLTRPRCGDDGDNGGAAGGSGVAGC
jgi:hypothetical protein